MMNSDEEILKAEISSLSNKVKILEGRLDEVHQIFNIHSTPIIVTDFDSQIRIANAQAFKLFDAEPRLVYSTDFLRQHFSQSDLKTWNQNIQKMKDIDQVDFEIRIKSRKGFIDIEVISIKLYYQGEDCILSYLRDITEHKIAEQNYAREHNQYQFVLDAIPAMIFIKDTESRIISINKTFEEITGLKKDELLGKRLFDLAAKPEIIEKYWRDDVEVIETGVAKRNILEPLFTDPGKWFITDKIPLLSRDGETIGIIGFSIDITERKNAEEALIRSEKKFRLLFNTSPDGIILCDLEGNFLTANKAYLDMLGYTMTDLLDMNYFDTLPQKWLEPAKAILKESLQAGTSSYIMEIEHCKKDGSAFPVLFSAWLMHNENNIPFQLGAYVKDLTFIKKAEELEKELLQKDKEQLERDLAAKNRELNTRITQLIETNELVNDVVSKLKDVVKIGEEDKNRQIKFIINDLINHSNEDLWLQFELTFGQIHPSFYDDLYEKYPELTPNERKLCAFLKMNLSTKDISSITHQSIRSIEVARFRLRKKMNLPRTTNLPKFLSGF
jgi:PAS domain S-box-containing protein